jgi:uncharacterized protein Usg
MFSQEYSFIELYKSFIKLCSDVELIKSKLELSPSESSSDDKNWMNIKQLQNYLPDKPSFATIYKWVSKKMIPYYKKSKSLSFHKSDIDGWLKSGRIKTYDENTNNIKEQVDLYLSTNKKSKTSKNKLFKNTTPKN